MNHSSDDWNHEEHVTASGLIELRRRMSPAGQWCMDKFVDGLGLEMDLNLVIQVPAKNRYSPRAHWYPGKLVVGLDGRGDTGVRGA